VSVMQLSARVRRSKQTYSRCSILCLSPPESAAPAALTGLPSSKCNHNNLGQNVHPTEVVSPRSFFGAFTGGRVS